MQITLRGKVHLKITELAITIIYKYYNTIQIYNYNCISNRISDRYASETVYVVTGTVASVVECSGGLGEDVDTVRMVKEPYNVKGNK